jgi:hypothetical protein
MKLEDKQLSFLLDAKNTEINILGSSEFFIYITEYFFRRDFFGSIYVRFVFSLKFSFYIIIMSVKKIKIQL